ncbi:MAG: NitT/TauT family transport system substrate-binding protein [Clostridiales bacterium]|jgi:NitT/TauT family transport system substrate-binding protein|nr:NitT/TauT family transport system substrate-binding protein [Clostridiales bacterium]MDN5299946.1 NitT/TauT family transport system substrate-binding protein [Clostridiales bacterium]
MKKQLLIIMAILMMSLAAGCQSQANEPAPESATAQETPATETPATETPATETPAAETPAPAAEPIALRAVAPEGATTIAMLKMIHDQPQIGDNVTVTYESLNTTDLLAADLMGEKTDFAIAPTNLAANFYQKGVPYSLVSINTHGNLYMVTTEAIEGWDAIKGKTVYMIGQGLVPDLIFRYLATSNGIDPDTDINIEYLSGASEIAPTFLSGKASIIIMPEPVLSVVRTKDVAFSVLFDFQKEYEAASGMTGGFPQAGLLVRNALIESHPEIVEAFIAQLGESCAWVNDNPEDAAAYMQELDLGIPGPVVIKAMPGLNIRQDSIADSKAALEKMFSILYEASPEAIGGAMPDEAFYQYGQ